jgi:hypothetical protein
MPQSRGLDIYYFFLKFLMYIDTLPIAVPVQAIIPSVWPKVSVITKIRLLRHKCKCCMPRTPHTEVDQIYKLQIVPPSNDIYYSYRNRYFCTMQSTTCKVTVIKPVISILIGSNFQNRKKRYV